MKHATRPLKLLLDGLASMRWAPLAAPVDSFVASPDLQLAAFSPDPFASLQRDAVALTTAAEPGVSPRTRKPASRPGPVARVARVARVSRVLPQAVVPASQLPGAETVADEPPWRPRAAAPELPQRARTPWPELPLGRTARGVPALDGATVQALLARFAPAVDAPSLDAAQLRQLATPQLASPSSPTAAPGAAPQQRAPTEPAATTPIPRRPLPERPSAGPAARGLAAAEAAPPSAPLGRASALAELLQRWPGATAAYADDASSPARRIEPPAAEFALMPSPSGTPLSAADLPAAFGTELPHPQPVGNDLPFTRTLERVLLAEVRRHGLEPDAS